MNRSHASQLTAHRLRDWRSRLGLTQADAAQRLGLSHRQYVAYERGETAIPKPISLACAAVVYGLPPME